jgi:hypothetical protein
MIAYKFLRDGKGRFSRFRWPEPGSDWVEASGPIAPCRSGIHACTAGDLPYWLDETLIELELDGEITTAPFCVVAQKARVLRRIDEWPAARADFLAECVARAARPIAGALSAEQQRLAGVLTGEVRSIAAAGNVATAAYVAAVRSRIAPTPAEADENERQERRAQAEWLAARLGLRG